eukprot:CAMPEP_0194314658 /NCGR_PEP_ID=MMETSP0171-20130528/11509_1 /TAXON_ID=218684 /ORGANISM="Corethron pennatum, Strain L29A3" /LENGTH=349 /DNA_ID=CAMNT_0039070179 /DNA_START=198 /DNA_END=1247 /DNA_ORIENTATION=+
MINMLLMFLLVKHLCAFSTSQTRAGRRSFSASGVSKFHRGLEYIDSKTLVSVEDSLDAYNAMKQGSDTEKNKIVFVDASWWHKGGLDGRTMFEKGPRISGAKYIDIDDIALSPDLNIKALPHMLPEPDLFAAAMDAFEIGTEDHIIIYARESVYFTTRVWFLFRTFGHDPSKLHLMQGSLEQWIDAGGDIDTEPTVVPKAKDLELGGDTNYGRLSAPSNVCDMDEVLDVFAQDGTDTLIIDSRGSSFRNGHMPGAIHIPYSRWVVSPDSTLRWKNIDEVRKIFVDAGVDPLTDKNIICSCGTGVSVCHTLLALELCGRDLKNEERTKMYDASWSEWGAEDITPKTNNLI